MSYKLLNEGWSVKCIETILTRVHHDYNSYGVISVRLLIISFKKAWVFEPLYIIHTVSSATHIVTDQII